MTYISWLFYVDHTMLNPSRRWLYNQATVTRNWCLAFDLENRVEQTYTFKLSMKQKNNSNL